MDEREIAEAIVRAELRAETAMAREALELRLLERIDRLQTQIERLAVLGLKLHGGRCADDPALGLPVARGSEQP